MIGLGVVMRNIGNFDMSSFGGRTRLQATVYLLQSFGLYLGYGFSWYIRGPYSPHLARNGFALQEDYENIPPGPFASRAARSRFAKFARFMADKKDDADRLEALASIHFLKRIRPGAAKSLVLARVRKKQPYFSGEQIEGGWKELAEQGLLPADAPKRGRGHTAAGRSPGDGSRRSAPAGLEGRTTEFPQSAVAPGLPKDYRALAKTLGGFEDRAAFFMLYDAACSPRPAAAIEKIHVDVFKNRRITPPEMSEGLVETVRIMADKALMRQIRESQKEVDAGLVVPWEEIRDDAEDAGGGARARGSAAACVRRAR